MEHDSIHFQFNFNHLFNLKLLKAQGILYGLQLAHKVRLTNEEVKNIDSKATQIAQNKVLRLLDKFHMVNSVTCML